MADERTHALYRFYDATGALLYIGITLDPGSRWRSHAQDKPWWCEVTRVDLETFPTRPAVLAAERAAIIAEKPAHNVVHNRTTSRPTRTAHTVVRTALPRASHGQVIHLFVQHRSCPTQHDQVEPNAAGTLACSDCNHLVRGCPCTRIQEVAFS